MYDRIRKSKRVIPITGNAGGSLAWSPDGRFIAYMGSANKLMANNWYPDVRIVHIESGKACTVSRRIYTIGASEDLLWLE